MPSVICDWIMVLFIIILLFFSSAFQLYATEIAKICEWKTSRQRCVLRTNFPHNRFAFRFIFDFIGWQFFARHTLMSFMHRRNVSELGKSVSESLTSRKIDSPEDICNKNCVNIKRFPVRVLSLCVCVNLRDVISHRRQNNGTSAMHRSSFSIKKKKTVECLRWAFIWSSKSIDAQFRRETGKNPFSLSTCRSIIVYIYIVHQPICSEIESEDRRKDLLNLFPLRTFSFFF